MPVVTRSHFRPGAAELLERLAAEGFRPGVPAHLSAAAQQADAEACAETRCPGCRARGPDYQPFHQGRRYRAVVSCPHCGWAEEL